MKERENLEFHAVLNFIEAYNRIHKRHLMFVRACVPPMPDTVCTLNGKNIGIEVVHSYGSGEEAKLKLGHCRQEDIPNTVHLARRIIPLNIRAVSSLNQQLANKASKSYNFYPVWLLIRNAFTLWGKDDYRRHRSNIIVPPMSFQRVWLFCDGNCLGTKGILRLA